MAVPIRTKINFIQFFQLKYGDITTDKTKNEHFQRI